MKRFYEPYKLSVIQRTFLTPYFGINALLNPERGDFVAGLGDVTGTYHLKQLRVKLLASPEGQQLLINKPLISNASLNMKKLRGLADETLGRAYSVYMDSHGFSADERTVVRFMMNEDLAYIMARYRQVHDFWHVLSGLPPTLLGEIALKCFEFEATGLPSCAMSAVLGQVKLTVRERAELHDVYFPWAKRNARSCGGDRLLAFDYEANFERSVTEVRKELDFEEAPIFFS